MLDAQGDTIRFEVLHDVPNTNVRLTVTPTRATLKFTPGLEPSEKLRIALFAGQVAGEMYAKGVACTWRGKIKLKSPLHSTKKFLAASMYQGDNRQQYWHHTEKTES